MKILSRYGPFVLLLFFLAACGTPPTKSPVEVQMTQMSSQVQACATLQALGTPYPCNPPTPTLVPTETPTPMPTPTKTPFTGWVYYPESGGATEMPYGFQPTCADHPVMGCPGQAYRYFVNGQPVSAEQGGYQETPGYWPYILFGIPVGIVLLAVLGFSIYQMNAPQRAIAQVTVSIGQAYAKKLLSGGDPGDGSRALMAPQDAGIPMRTLARWLQQYMRQFDVPEEFKPEIGKELSKYTPDQLISIVTIQTMLAQFDKRHGSAVSKGFGEFLSRRVN